MIDINELVTKFSNILNGLDNETSSIQNPATSFYFGVKTYGTHLDTIALRKIRKSIIPVFISDFSGSVEPIPNLGEVNGTFNVFIYFPIEYKDTFFQLRDYFVEVFNTKTYDYGVKSGKAISTLSIPELQNIEVGEFGTLASFLQETYGLEIQKSSMWGVMTFSVFFHQVKDFGKDNGYVIGNQTTLKISYKGLTEDITYTQIANKYEADQMSQQIFGTKFTNSIVKNSSYVISFQAYVKKNDFWKQIITDLETFNLYNQKMIIEKNTPFGVFRSEQVIVSAVTTDDIGETKAITFTLTNPINSTTGA